MCQITFIPAKNAFGVQMESEHYINLLKRMLYNTKPADKS